MSSAMDKALQEVEHLDASVRDAAGEEIKDMHRHANQKKLHIKLRDKQETRRGKLSKRTAALVRARTEAAKQRNQARLEAERASLASAAKTAADSVEAAADVLTSRWKADALHAEAEAFVRKHMEWAWRITKEALVAFPRRRGVVQFKFVCPDTEHFDTGYINVAIIFIHGWVWALPSTHMGGVAELIDNLPNREVVLNAESAMAQLPDSPFFSASFGKNKKAITLGSIDMQRVPLMRPSFWAGDAVPSDIVLADIVTKEDYERVFDTVEKCVALSKKTQAHVVKLETDLARAQAQAHAERQPKGNRSVAAGSE